MATHLQQLLQSLCWNTEWNYAVFWRFKHQAHMVLTWEDAFFNNSFKHDASESKLSTEPLESLHDSLGLAVAKMSYHVYALGEGIVGQVAVSGKHQWINAGDYTMDPSLFPEICDEWQAQFSAGVKTIVVAAVVPHGVVQLGSLNEVRENLKLLIQIRDLFSSLQDSSACQVPKQSNISYGTSLPVVHPTEAMIMNTSSHLSEVIDNVELMHSISESQQFTDMPNDKKHRSNTIGIQHVDLSGDQKVCLSSPSCLTSNSTTYDVNLSAGDYKMDPLENLQFDKNVDFLPEFNSLESLDDLKSSFTFSSGSELHEALGPAFAKNSCHFSWEKEKLDDGSASHMPEITENSLLTSDSGSDHLLEAVVANFCHKNVSVKSPVSVSMSMSMSKSMLTTEKMPEPSINTNHTIGSSCYSISSSSLMERSTLNCLSNSDSCNIWSSKSASRDTFVRPVEPGKTNKKRARPGENLRPRPRDRQLIQDRIKELRELVPNGSKCSIDSLLERTIKHMVFMQSVTKHADKLGKCSKSRGCSKETGVLGPGYEQGSSWALEVGGHMKICPIVVENLNMNGQMLIEMLCEDCDHFLEITETIRSLGLNILKGLTDNHGEKTCMRFVVEGQNNRNVHRMDVLWSLVQILQSKATA